MLSLILLDVTEMHMHTILHYIDIDQEVPICEVNQSLKDVNCYPTVVDSDFIEGS